TYPQAIDGTVPSNFPGSSRRRTGRSRREDGERRWMRWRAAAVVTPGGTSVYLGGFGRLRGARLMARRGLSVWRRCAAVAVLALAGAGSTVHAQSKPLPDAWFF